MQSKFVIYINRFSILLSIFVTVHLTKVRAQDCGHEELAKCAKPLQVLQSTTDLTFAPKREELDKLCPDLNRGLSCISSYTRRCMTLTQRNQFNAIYKGTNEVIRDLCREGEYQDEFLKHSTCLQKVKPQHELCALRYQQTMSNVLNISKSAQQQYQQQDQYDQDGSENVKTVCCSFREYLDCSEHVTRRVCGEKTGLFIRGFLKKMSDILIKNYCEEYYKGSNRCSYQFSSGHSTTIAFKLLLFSLITILLSISFR